MPFSDCEGYDSGHFDRVYEHLIKPSCLDAGVEPVRGDEVKSTNYIALDILQRILQSDLVVCDLSAKNPNVMYELGVRQAFDLPVVLLKDRRTERVFDIQGLRTLDYTESLRVDSIAVDRKNLAATISATLQLETHEVNSLVGLLGIQKAKLGSPTKMSLETALILSAIKDVSGRLSAVEEASGHISQVTMARAIANTRRNAPGKVQIRPGTTLTVGEEIFLEEATGSTTTLGTLVGVDQRGLILQPKMGGAYTLSKDDPRFERVTDIPY